MAIVVSGAAGFVAFHLCERLLKEGQEVIGIDNFASGQQDHADALRKYPNFRWIQANISQPFEVPGPVSAPGGAGGRPSWPARPS
jgi:dTDP-glucose 4,6-dehydratase